MSMKFLSATIIKLSIGLISLFFSGVIYAQIPPPKIVVTDEFGVNLHSGQVTQSLNTTAIGGALGLSHSISTYANNFSIRGVKGYVDKFIYRNSQYVSMGDRVEGFAPTTFYAFRVYDLSDTADFKILSNGVVVPDGVNLTSNYSYVALGDERHTLVINGNYLDWTKPDGTLVKLNRGRPDATAGATARFEQIIYPNGFSITVNSVLGVRTNTGFQLKYLYVVQDLPLNKPDIASEWLPFAQHKHWTENNPAKIAAINSAVEFCADDAVSCSLTKTWPTATFIWPGGMPRAMYLGESVFSVLDAENRKTSYYFTARDLALSDAGILISGQTANVRFSPRLTSIKHANGSLFTYEYKNLVGIEWTGATTLTKLVTEVGITRSAIKNEAGTGYSLGQPVNAGALATINKAYLPGGVTRDLLINPLYGDNLNYIITTTPNPADTDRIIFEASFRNFPTSHTSSTGPSEYYYYTRGNLDVLSKGNGIAIIARYPETCTPATIKTCNKPIWMKDPKGNQTDYTYHEPSGQLETVTSPANAQGIRAQTRYGYEQKFANYFQDTSGIKKISPTGIWLKTSEKTCMKTATSGDACTGGPADEVVTTYEYTTDNLLLKGVVVAADGKTRRTCYQYDIYGNRISETKPKAGLTSCPN
jgi:YD repeat-containing protein